MSQKFKSELELQALNNATTDTDKFLVSDGGIVKYRTGTEVLSDLGVTLNTASKLQHQVKAGVAINKGQAVYVTSADGTNMIVGLASNASEATSSKTMGLLDATVAINDFANVVTEGLLSGLNTATANAGDPVWLGTNGNLIYGLLNKPYAPAHLVFIGIVTRVNANNGEIFVKVQNGFELDELHDVDLKTTTPINGDILGFDGTLWVNKTIAGWLGYAPANANGTTNYVSKFTSATTLGDSQIFDNGNGVGINTASPNYTTTGRGVLDINGSSQSMLALSVGGIGKGFLFYTGTDLLVSNEGNGSIKFNTNGSEKVIITSSGSVGIGTTSPSTKLDLVGSDPGIRQSVERTSGGVAFSMFNLNAKNTTSGLSTSFGSIGVYGNLNVGPTPPSVGYIYMGADSTTAYNDNTFRLYPGKIANFQGNVGIGTTSPSARLDINGNMIVGAGNKSIGSWPFYISDSSNLGWKVSNSSGTSKFELYVGNAGINQMRLLGGVSIVGFSQDLSLGTSAYLNTVNISNTNGNVGIGNTSPTQKLDVTGNIKISNNNSLMFRNAANNADISIIQLTNTNQLNLGTTSSSVPSVIALHTNSTERMRITSGGEILIGGTFNPYPASNRGNITLNGSSSNIIAFTNNSLVRGYLYHDDNNFEILNNVNVGAIISYTQSNERMRITAGGNVGIGTSSPTAKLHVEGSFVSNSPNAYFLVDSTNTIRASVTSTTYGTGAGFELMDNSAAFGFNPFGDFRGVRADYDNGVWFVNESGGKLGLQPVDNNLFSEGGIIQVDETPSNKAKPVAWIKIYNNDNSSFYFMPVYQ